MAGAPEDIANGLQRHREGDLAGAKIAYLQALAAHPGDPDVLCLLGSVRLALGEFREAEDNLAQRSLAGRSILRLTTTWEWPSPSSASSARPKRASARPFDCAGLR